MNVTTCAALLGASLLGSTLGAQAPVDRPAGQAQDAPASLEKAAEDPVRGPKLGSPDIYQVGDDVHAPTVLKEVKVAYTPEAKAAGIKGTVRMDCVVLPDGTVGDVKVTQLLDPGLDREAVAALRKWTFNPGTLSGRPVPVQVMVEMSFTLK
ncbi:MAG: energy transducer TonB [Acidobacteriota bacterium]